MRNGGASPKPRRAACPTAASPRITTRRWDEWDRLDLPVLVLRGADSDLLSPSVFEAMRARGPRAVGVTIEGCGHAPALNTPEQLGLVERFLLAA